MIGVLREVEPDVLEGHGPVSMFVHSRSVLLNL